MLVQAVRFPPALPLHNPSGASLSPKVLRTRWQMLPSEGSCGRWMSDWQQDVRWEHEK